MPTDPAPVRIHPGKTEFGLLRSCAAAGARRRRVPPPLPPRSKPHCPIRNRRPRLEPILIRSGPLDLDPVAWIHAYRFGPGFLLKSPRPFSDSTRSPILFKNNYTEVLFLAHNPLSFFKIGPAVQVRSFCGLDPEALVYLRFSPWFLQKTPLNPVFLTNKPLNLVFSLEYAF